MARTRTTGLSALAIVAAVSGAALAHCQKRYEDKYDRFKKEPSGGLGAFSPDNFPVFDAMKENCYVIADSSHGYKMIGPTTNSGESIP